MKILMILTSHSELGETGLKTGFWLEEFAAPYYALKDAGAVITLASPRGNQPPVDPQSLEPANQTEATHRFDKDKELQQLLAHTTKISMLSADDFDAVFYPGGHGPMWDLTQDIHSIYLIKAFIKNKKPVAVVCHAPAVLLNITDDHSVPYVKGKKVTGFSNTEEAAVKLDKVVPFSLENELKKKGGIYSKKADWAPYVITDGLLITGQNPASSAEAAMQLLALMKKEEYTVIEKQPS